VKLDLEFALDFLRQGLNKTKMGGSSSSEYYNLTGVKLVNGDTILIEFYANKLTSIEIKTEIMAIVSATYAFLDDNPLVTLKIENIATNALDSDGRQLMYSFSSIMAAQYASKGQPIEWLNGSIFNDSTAGGGLQVAKNRIYQIENALRDIIDQVMSLASGPGWWNNLLPIRVRSGAEKAFRKKFGQAPPKARDLLNYTYLPNLKDVVLENWPLFGSIFTNRLSFENDMNELNDIRRDESHNRKIGQSSVSDLENIYTRLMGNISLYCQEIVPGYLLENWRSRVADAVENYKKLHPEITREDKENPQIVIDKFKQLIDLSAATRQVISSIVIPPGKNDISEELICIFTELHDALTAMLGHAKDGRIREMESAANRHQEVIRSMDDFAVKYLLEES
jgi:hypothetical protein